MFSCKFDPVFQEAVFFVLSAYRFFDPLVFFSEVHAVRDKHSSPLHCDRLMAMAPKNI